MSQWHVYMVVCRDGSIYTGIAKDVQKRIETHNKGRGAKYTRSRRPVKLLKSWAVGRVGDALRMEASIKKLPRSEKLNL